MSSEHDESAEMLEDLSMKSDAEKSGSPPPKKFQGTGDHAKSKRRGRRGKKRKQRKASGAAESENQEDSETHPENRDSPTWDSDEELDCEINAYNDVIIRPVNVPKAPENSTQFIIDDHNLCQLYMSFETPNPYLQNDPQDSGKEEGDIVFEPAGTDAAYEDIDFEYDPPQDFDNTAYNDKEFELSYKNNRFEELLRLPRSELVSGLRLLEGRLKELSDELVKENPSPILEQLQAELLELQEKHIGLKDSNTSLVARTEAESDISVVQNSQKTKCDKAIEQHSPALEMEVDQRHSQSEAEHFQHGSVNPDTDPIKASERTSDACVLSTKSVSKNASNIEHPNAFFSNKEREELNSKFEEASSRFQEVNDGIFRIRELDDVNSRVDELDNVNSRLDGLDDVNSRVVGLNDMNSRIEELSDVYSHNEGLSEVNSCIKELRGVKSTIDKLEELKSRVGVGGDISASTHELKKVEQRVEVQEVKSSCELERSSLRDLPCRDFSSCDEPSHNVASEDLELSAAVLV